jgi:NADPH-dependent glutamate synthase beta subunit-like oxidoreductase
MKLDKDTVQRRVDLMAEEGITFLTGCEVGADIVGTMGGFDATVLAIGSTVPNNLPIPGRELDGVVYAMEFLTQNQNALFANPAARTTTQTTPEVGLTSKYGGKFISAAGKNVIVIGGGDTGTDCIGTSLRHGCQSLTNFELFPAPPAERAAGNPWPLWPRIMRVDYGHEEATMKFGNDPRSYSILSKAFLSDGSGKVKAVKTVNIAVGADGRFSEVEGSEKEWPADLVILAMGFRHPEQTIVQALDLQTDARNNTKANTKDYRTSANGVFAAGDCRRGQSLVVWAINEGRGVAKVRAGKGGVATRARTAAAGRAPSRSPSSHLVSRLTPAYPTFHPSVSTPSPPPFPPTSLVPY